MGVKDAWLTRTGGDSNEEVCQSAGSGVTGSRPLELLIQEHRRGGNVQIICDPGEVEAKEWGEVGFPSSVDNLDFGVSAKQIEQAVEASLRRMGIETIDLYYMHAGHPNRRRKIPKGGKQG